VPALLGIGWGSAGTTAPFSSMGVGGLVLDTHNANIGERHTLRVGMRHTDLTMLPTPPTLAPPTLGRAIYGISIGADIRMFTSFAEFSSQLAELLGGGRPAMALTASGSYEAGSGTLYATRIAVLFAPN
jgi:hypothetical protein